MKFIFSMIAALACVVSLHHSSASALGEIRFDFEDGDEGWSIPDWSFNQKDHKAISSEVSTDFASSGTHSLKVMCDFPGDVWTAALVDKEFEDPVDLYGYHSISVDMYLPKNAPKELMLARMILTVGEEWRFTEMRFPVQLKAGKWTTVSARLESYEVPDPVWKGRAEKRLFLNIRKVRKVAVRIEYDIAPPYRLGTEYKGPVYIDNMVIEPGGPENLLPPSVTGEAAEGSAAATVPSGPGKGVYPEEKP